MCHWTGTAFLSQQKRYILKIDQSVKMSWHRLNMGVECFYLSAHGHGRQVALDSSTCCKQEQDGIMHAQARGRWAVKTWSRNFVLMAIIVSIECRKDVFKCSVCGKNLSNLKAERRKFRAVSDDLFACFGPLEEESPHEPGKKFLCGTCRRALADFKKTGQTFFHVSKNAISQQSVTICVS